MIDHRQRQTDSARRERRAISELKVRNGRLTAKVNGLWHIVPSDTTAAWVPDEPVLTKPTTGK